FHKRFWKNKKLIVHPTGKLLKMVKINDDGTIDKAGADEKYLPEELEIVALFQVGNHDIDISHIIVNIDKAATMMGLEWGQATSIKVITDDPYDFDKYIKMIQANPAFSHYNVVSWREMNETLFDALQVERSLMFYILIFIVIVAAFCVCATLITIVFQKTREIGILLSCGASKLTVMLIFFIQGGIIGLLGVAGGTALGLYMVWIRNDFLEFLRKHLDINIFPPDLYKLPQLPAIIDKREIMEINIYAFILCVLSALIPALMAISVKPATALRSE
ncbi:MAG: ABC transporter permease, partial [Lentisphaeria bacterium]|nr:ABC transporter permease [Lentisphaeria bacterium]